MKHEIDRIGMFRDFLENAAPGESTVYHVGNLGADRRVDIDAHLIANLAFDNSRRPNAWTAPGWDSGQSRGDVIAPANPNGKLSLTQRRLTTGAQSAFAYQATKLA